MLGDIPTPIRETVPALVNTRLRDFHFCSGGCINYSGTLVTDTGHFFLKWNDAKKFPGMFAAEAKGLRLLHQPSVIRVPEVLTTATAGTWQFIVLECIEEKTKSNSYWKILGEKLALLHRNSAVSYGLDHQNYIGSLVQLNTPKADWINFFIEQRLEVQLRLASDHGKADKKIRHQFQSLYKKLAEYLPEEKPALLHGDLWSGNLITDSSGEPCLIDPAVYYGHREAEIAFTRLFGGFSKQFYDSYLESLPLLPGYQERFQIYNLYPLMVHLNLFGGGYRDSVVSILRQFV